MKSALLMSTLIISTHLVAATLTFDVSKIETSGFYTYTKGADVAGSFTPVKGKSFNIPNAPGKNIPVNTNMQIINSATSGGTPPFYYPASNVAWAANWQGTGYSFDLGVDSKQWTKTHQGECISIAVDGANKGTCCSFSKNWHQCTGIAKGVNFTAGSHLQVTLTPA